MIVRSRTIRRLAILALAFSILGTAPAAPGTPGQAASASAPTGEPPAERVLVAPMVFSVPIDANAPSGQAIAQVAQSLPALIAETLSADRALTASLAHDLSPDTLESLGIVSDLAATIPDAAKLAAPESAKALLEDGSIRIVVFPSIEVTGGSGKKPAISLTLKWTDLVAKQEGSVVESARDAAGLIDAAGRATFSVRKAWLPFGQGTGATAPKIFAVSIAAITSKVPAAIESWAKAGEAWNHGDPPGAEAALKTALTLDPAFDRARVDLAWIRCGQGRLDEAGSLAAEALKGSRLSLSARAFAEIIQAAATRDPGRLESVAARLEAEAPAQSHDAPWGALASGLALNMKGEHHRAIGQLDRIRLHHPNDPAILHQAGMAGLGGEDILEARAHLERAAALWPAHDRIQMDLAETRVRAHDIDGAQAVLEAWGKRYHPGDPPIWGGDWSYEDPPPLVRSQMVKILTGSLSSAIEFLDGQELLLEAASAPVSLRLIVLRTMHELQNRFYFGTEMQKLRSLGAARDSFTRMKELTPPEERERHPWVLLSLEAGLRLREKRLPEAKALREKLAAVSSLPGYDPAMLAEIDAAIAVQEGETDEVFEEWKKAVEARGRLDDLYESAVAYAVAAKWREVREIVGTIEGRLETWNVTRRRDAILWSPEGAAVVPFVYSLGGATGYWLGNGDYSHGQFGIFLAYFRAPDPPFRHYAAEAQDRGSRPAW